MIPSALVVLDALPLTANGKLDRQALPEPGGEGAVVSGGYTAPRTEVEERLALMWAEALGLERVGINDNFFELGGHSLMATRLFRRIEAEFERSIPLAILFRAQTVSEMAAILVEAPVLDPRPRTLTLRTGDSRRLPLFLVHSRSGEGTIGHLAELLLNEDEPNTSPFAIAPNDQDSWTYAYTIKEGGAVAPLIAVHAFDGIFNGLAHYLPDNQAFYAITTRSGFDGRRLPFHPCKSVDEIVTRYMGKLRELQPSGPYSLIGFCRGALVAYEMARRLTEVGEEVLFLGIVDGFPRVSRDPALGQSTGTRLRAHFSRVSQLPWRSRIEYVWTRLRGTGRLWWASISLAVRSRIVEAECYIRNRVHLPISPELLEWRVNKFGHRMFLGYSPQKWDGRLTAFYSGDEPPPDPQFWSRFATQGAEVHRIPGGHFSMMAKPNVKDLAEKLNASLAMVQEQCGAGRKNNHFLSATAPARERAHV